MNKAGRRASVLWLFCAGAALASALTIATYNVENYVVADRMVEGHFRQSYPKPEAEKRALRRVISDLAPDILTLSEMGPQPYLEEFQRDLRHEGQDFPHAALLEAVDAERHVAVLSKVPFKEIRRHADVPITLFGRRGAVKRGVLEVTFSTTGGDLTLFIVHLKSPRTEHPDDPGGVTQRRLEARAVREVVLGRFPDPAKAKFIVLGDFNAAPADKSLAALLKRGSLAVGRILPAVDSRGEGWTYHFRRYESYSRIDLLLASPGLGPLIDGGRAYVFDGPGVGDASDHRPVYVRLKTEPVK
ncbi:MAG: endonuclease/exonuclease/phosphatase family protein [Opitutaceae bacterium]|nr:endonuclease/exonuclease/phosphatase family protein [Opitutaceae bacterium]